MSIALCPSRLHFLCGALLFSPNLFLFFRQLNFPPFSGTCNGSVSARYVNSLRNLMFLTVTSINIKIGKTIPQYRLIISWQKTLFDIWIEHDNEVKPIIFASRIRNFNNDHYCCLHESHFCIHSKQIWSNLDSREKQWNYRQTKHIFLLLIDQDGYMNDLK